MKESPDATQRNAVPHDQETDETSAHLRGHCLAAGRLFQATGMILLLGAGLVWLLSGWIIPPATEPIRQWRDFMTGPHRVSALMMIDLIVAVVGGLGLFGVGIGLSGERPTAGRWGMGVTGVTGLMFLATAFGFAADGAIGLAIAALVPTLLSGALFLAAAHCAAILKRFPPPEHNIVTEEFLERYRRERAERRKQYDL